MDPIITEPFVTGCAVVLVILLAAFIVGLSRKDIRADDGEDKGD